MNLRLILFVLSAFAVQGLHAADSLTPYAADHVPQNATDLWKNVDFRQDPLDTEIIKPNTDWGKVDPSQGPRFYPGALRPSVKLNLLPDEHTIDPVVSPRNGNWYLLAYAGRRAITFLQQQPEVDPAKIGFTGYSMGGNITSMVAIDQRLKAVVPMVGGSGFIMDNFPGLPDTGRARGFRNVDLYNRTVDARSYWPHVKCPVLFLSASDDFHAVFDNLYKSAKGSSSPA